MGKRILITRNFASEVNTNSYNLQEIGMGKAFVNKGFDCDVIYYCQGQPHEEVIYELNRKKLTIFWSKGLKVMSNSIYYSLLKKSLINKYDFIISTEYNQIMTFLLSNICGEKLFIYHGPYKDNNNKIVQTIYDVLFTPIIRKKVKKVLVKSDLAKEYLIRKGFNNVKTIGVGLDIKKFKSKTIINDQVIKKIDFKKNNLFYVGILEDRRNIEFLFKVVAKLVKKNPQINLVLVGDGKIEITKKYFLLANELNILDNIIHIKKLNQNELRILYEKLDLFIFPTSYDIFGMVLLESMYFKMPVVSTYNGGAQTLINNSTGVIINELNEEKWSNIINNLLLDKKQCENLGENAHNLVINQFTWDYIVERILN